MENLTEKPVFPTLGTSERSRVVYLFYRYREAPAVMPASLALLNARKGGDASQYLPRYSETRARRDAEGRAWVENPAGAGLRFAGYADDLADLSHRGWYTEDTMHDAEIARGAVYQLPARNGRPQYVPAMLDPHNNGPALFDFSNIFVGERDENNGGFALTDMIGAHRSCARAADSIAENYAEREREYQTAWRAGADYADKGAEMGEHREDARALIDAIRHDTVGIDRLRGLLSETLGDLQQLREEREELRAANDNPTDRDAFNDGAGIA